MGAPLCTSALVLGLLACLCAPALARRPLGKDGRQPNIVLLLTDDQDAVMGVSGGLARIEGIATRH